MLKENLQKMLNDQLNLELYSAYAYYSMAAYMDNKSLDGFAHWMKLQAEEELQHAQKIYNYLCDTGSKVTMQAIKQPPVEFSSPLDAFKQALEHEKHLAVEINKISVAASQSQDNTTVTFLDWFLTEQVEEVAQTSTICDKLEMTGDNGHGILLLNNELRERQREAAAGE
jgi:ferritin